MSNQNREPHDWLDLAQRASYCASETARLLEIDIRTLERRFLEDCGLTPREWLKAGRMWMAAALASEGKSPKEMFGDLGFKQVTGLLHSFRDYHSCTIGEYLRTHLERETRGVKHLKKYWRPSKTTNNLIQAPQHTVALETLGQIPTKSKQLHFYFIRFRSRIKASSVASTQHLSFQSSHQMLPTLATNSYSKEKCRA